jgi:hypothetical protein
MVVDEGDSACTKPLVGTLLLMLATPVGAMAQVTN